MRLHPPLDLLFFHYIVSNPEDIIVLLRLKYFSLLTFADDRLHLSLLHVLIEAPVADDLAVLSFATPIIQLDRSLVLGMIYLRRSEAMLLFQHVLNVFERHTFGDVEFDDLGFMWFPIFGSQRGCLSFSRWIEQQVVHGAGTCWIIKLSTK